MNKLLNKKGFGTGPVFFTAISTILGAILFLRFGYAVGTLGFAGVILIVITGHLVTIPTALAISEIATNQRVEGGGEYYIISRSFGLNIGATIGIALYFSQAISIAFYVIAFTEAFEPLFNFVKENYDIILPRQVISIPSMLLLSLLILKKGANMGVKALYFVVGILFVSLILFFAGKTEYSTQSHIVTFSDNFRNFDNFFVVFAIIFPAFTGMTAGVGLSGDLKNPGKSIPLGTTVATVFGMIIYFFIIWKLNISASPEDLVGNQLIMAKIALYGTIIIPLGLAASTLSSALGSIMVAPRTLQALAKDRSFPVMFMNKSLAKGKGEENEPFNASLLTCLIALVFVALGNVNAVAEVISMFFMVTYGSLNLISFLNHFGSDPSYRPTFHSKWYISLLGFLMSVWLMFKINSFYALAAFALMVLLYLYIRNYHKERKGFEALFRGALFQLNRNLQVFVQRNNQLSKISGWRPSAICVSSTTFEREKAFDLLRWISYRYGFGTYIHLITGYFSNSTRKSSEKLMKKLIERANEKNGNVYVDTIISPSYTSAIAQIIQLPSVSGMDNNMIIFEFDKENNKNLKQFVENYALVNAGKYDTCVIGTTSKRINFKNGIHIWIRSIDFENANLMILLSYIIMGHPEWKKSKVKIMDVCKEEVKEETKTNLINLIQGGRLPISENDIEILIEKPDINIKDIINEKSANAGLTVIGFRGEQVQHRGEELFEGYDNVGDVLFVNAYHSKEIN
ncbi:MAG: amino acid permease [Chlorobi bacterium]|nr:amino acid permease [Chlorobiota bacterium]